MMTNKNLIRTSVQLPAADVYKLREIAQRQGVSVSLLVRRALRDYLIFETIDEGGRTNGRK